jgi:hypothetical protein
MECVLFVDDFNPWKAPSSSGKKFYVLGPASTVNSSGAADSSPNRQQQQEYYRQRDHAQFGSYLTIYSHHLLEITLSTIADFVSFRPSLWGRLHVYESVYDSLYGFMHNLPARQIGIQFII